MSAALPDITFFHELADVASQHTLPRYRNGPIHIDTKPKEGTRFDPVTDADRLAEQAMRQLINERYPDHAIIGEEYGASGSGVIEWVLDPVDGTRPFICGLPVWGTLIGLNYAGRSVMGMMSQPFTGERFWSDGDKSYCSGPAGERILKASHTVNLAEAILHTTAPLSSHSRYSDSFASLLEQTRMTRYGGECYAMAMLAAGHIDICVEFSLQPYDIAALIPIIEHAGGVVTTFAGERAEAGGAVIASANATLHEQVLKILSSAAHE